MSPAFLLPLLFLIPPEPPKVQDPRVAMVEEVEAFVRRLPQDDQNRILPDLAAISARLGMSEKAWSLAETVEDATNLQYWTLHSLAISFAQANRVEDAIQAAERSLKVPGYGGDAIWGELATILGTAGNLPAAEGLLKRVRQPVDRTPLLVSLALFELEQERSEEAARLAMEALVAFQSLNKRLTITQLKLQAHACILAGQTERLSAIFQQMEKVPKTLGDPSENCYSQPILTLAKTGNFSRAFELAFQRKFDFDPTRQELLIELCRLRIQKGEPDQVLSFIQEPDQESNRWCNAVLKELVLHEIARNNFSEAQKIANRIVDFPLRIDTCLLIAKALHQADQSERAMEILAKIEHQLQEHKTDEVTEKIEQSKGFARLSQLHAQWGSKKAARRCLDQALQAATQQPGDGQSLLLSALEELVTAHLQSGETQAVRQLLDSLWEKTVQHLHTLENILSDTADLGMVASQYIRLGEVDAAVSRTLALDDPFSSSRHWIFETIAEAQGTAGDLNEFPQWMRQLPAEEEPAKLMIKFLWTTIERK